MHVAAYVGSQQIGHKQLNCAEHFAFDTVCSGGISSYFMGSFLASTNAVLYRAAPPSFGRSLNSWGAADFVLRSLSAGDIDRALSTETPELSKRAL